MPEELNRVLTDHLASLLFCPTDTAVANLAHEGIEAGVVQTGDVMFDLATATLSPQREREVLSRRGLEPGRYVMATVHRAATADDPARLAAVLGRLRRPLRDRRVSRPSRAPRPASSASVSAATWRPTSG